MLYAKTRHYGPAIGRVLLSLVFIISGIGILTNVAGTAAFYASVGIPAAAIVAILIIILKIGGGLLVATGIHAREGAWALIIFVILATLIAHTSAGEMLNALKNLAIIGGLLMVAAHGAGPLSLAHKCPCKKCKAKHTPSMPQQ